MKRFFIYILYFIISINKTTSHSNKSLKNLDEKINCMLFTDCFNCSVCGEEILENFEECPCYWNTNFCNTYFGEIIFQIVQI